MPWAFRNNETIGYGCEPGDYFTAELTEVDALQDEIEIRSRSRKFCAASLAG